jgi:hypothetical protein
MSQLTYKEHQIDQRGDNYVNLTQMAKANKVRLNKYFESVETQKYLKAAQESICHESCQLAETTLQSQRPDSGQWDLVQVVSTNQNKATWGHPLVALHFGQWVSPEFHVWCNQNIHTLMATGSTSIDGYQDDRIDSLQSEVSQLKELVANLQPKPSLPRASVDPIPQQIEPLTERALVNRLIRSYVHNQTTSQPKTEQDVYRWMYLELKYRYHYDVYARVKKSGLKSKLDQIEADGYLPQLLAICNYFLSN